MSFKTTITYPNYVPLPQETIDTIVSWVGQQGEAGKYTGENNSYYMPDNTTYVVERWAWIDEATCQEYFTFVNSQTSETNIDTITEIVAL